MTFDVLREFWPEFAGKLWMPFAICASGQGSPMNMGRCYRQARNMFLQGGGLAKKLQSGLGKGARRCYSLFK